MYTPNSRALFIIAPTDRTPLQFIETAICKLEMFLMRFLALPFIVNVGNVGVKEQICGSMPSPDIRTIHIRGFL